MKKVSTLFDALRNERFAIAVQDDYGVKYYGSEGQGKEWSNWANSFDTKTLDTNNLPAGIIQGPYKNMSDNSLKSLLTAFGNNISEIGNSYTDSKSYSYKSSMKIDNGARVPAVMDTPIGHFTKSQYSSAVNYKGLVIRTQIKEESFLFEARANNYAFNFENWMYNSTPSKAEIKSLRHRIDTNVGRSSERRLGMKFKTALVERDGRYRVGYAQTLETKSLEDSLELKGIGQRIGGGARIGRRAAHSMAMFDPKAWDGDGDGVVQEGTPFERPAIPGINDRATGGVVDTDAAKKAWKDFQKNPSSSTVPKEPSPARRAMREGARSVGRQVLTTRKPADTGRKIPGKKPSNRSGFASKLPGDKNEAGVNPLVAKEVVRKIEDVLYKRDTLDSFSAFIDGLGPDGGQELSAEQVFDIKEAIQLYDNDEYDMDDLYSSVSAAVTRKKPDAKPSQSGMRSRVGKAQVDRQVQGLASRSSRSKAKSKLKATPGRDKVDEKDGSLWASLTPEQQDVVKKNTQAAYEGLQTYIKKDKYLGTWWDSFLRLPRKKGAKDADGNEWSDKSRISGEAFTSFQVEINRSIDDANLEIEADERALAAAKAGMPDAEIKKAENRIANKKKQIERIQKVLDDLRTYDQMDKTDDWSLLEHLHPEQRKKSFGLNLGKSEAGMTVSPFADGKLPKGMKVGEPSTIFEEIGGVKRDAPRLIGEKGDRKLEDLANRILRPNPQRVERRRLRKAGRGTAVETAEEASEQLSPLKRRIRRAKNQFLLNVKSKRNPEDIESRVSSSLKKNNHAFKREDGSIKIDDKAIDAMAIMTEAFKVKKKRGAKGEAVVTNTGARKSLVGLWNANSFNATPVWIREDEIPAMIEQGWIPIKRGFGREEFADVWLNSPKRHVTGQGAAVVGAGEYWSYAEGGWDSYFGGRDGKQTDGVIAMVKRDRIIDSSRIQAMKEDHSTISKAVDAYISGAGSGGRWDSELSTQELVQEIEQTLSKMIPADSEVWNTEWGKVYQGVFQWMKTVDPKDTEKQKKAVEVLKLLNRIGDSDATIQAGFLGYDGVDFGLSDGRIVMHNRSAMLAVNEPKSLADIKKAAKGEGVKVTAEKTKVKKPSRKVGASSTKAKGSSKSLDNKSWKQVGKQGGSQPGGEFEDPSGNKFYVKKQKSKLHAENEVLMSKLYERLGVRAAKNSEGTAHIQGQSPGPGVFSEWLNGSRTVNHSAEVRNPQWKKSVQDTFVANAWLANWDGTGNGDNIKMGADGEAYVVDTGGAGLFRARGDAKGTGFGPIVGEMESLRDPGLNSLGAMYYGDISPQEIARQVAVIGALSDADIRMMVNATVTDSVEAKKLVDTLIARRDYLVNTWGTGIRK